MAVDDSALAITDTGGAGVPVVYLNGQFARQGCWRKVIAELGPGFRHITYDERGCGKSTTSADYSFATCVRDVDAILATRGVDQVLWWAGPTGRTSPPTGLTNSQRELWAL